MIEPYHRKLSKGKNTKLKFPTKTPWESEGLFLRPEAQIERTFHSVLLISTESWYHLSF